MSATFEQAIESTTQKLVQGYELDGHLNHPGLGLPSRSAIANLLSQFEAILFPGFELDEEIHDKTLQTSTQEKLEGLHRIIEELMDKAQGHRDSLNSNPSPPTLSGHDAANAIVQELPRQRELISGDIEAIYNGDPAVQSKNEVVLAYPGLQAIWVHRVAHVFWQRGFRLLARMMSERVHGQTGIDIHPGAQIGKAFYIDHGTGVVIGETTIIGDHVKLYQGVSLGALSVSREKFGSKRHPTIENNVTIYAGATILGGETVVGHHSIVGGNVWLVESVPAFSVVSTSPQIQVRPKKETEGTWTYEI
jgi:serine O-acetyltransferase